MAELASHVFPMLAQSKHFVGVAGLDCGTGGSPSSCMQFQSEAIADQNSKGITAETQSQSQAGSTISIEIEKQTSIRSLQKVVEDRVSAAPSGRVSLLDLLKAEEVNVLVGKDDHALEQLCKLRDSVVDSEKVLVQGPRIVMRQPAWLPGNELADDSDANIGQFLQDMESSIFSPMWGCSWQQPGQRKQRLDRQSWILTTLHGLLQNPPAEVSSQMDSEGSVSVSTLFGANLNLTRGLYSNASLAVRAVTSGGRGFLVADEQQLTVRLATSREHLCAFVEVCVLQGSPPCPMRLSELLEQPHIHATLAQASGSSGEGTSEFAAELRSAVVRSELLMLSNEGKDPLVVPVPPERLVLAALEWVLREDYRTIGMLRREGEVPLGWITERPRIRMALAQAQAEGVEAELELLRNSVKASEGFILDAAHTSVRPVEVLCPNLGARPGHTTQTRRCKYVPVEKDVRTLRQLLSFYFQPFNLQHNQLLMSHVELQRKRANNAPHAGYLRSNGLRPVFDLAQLQCLPRVGRIFEMYDASAAPCVLAAALQTADEPLPVRIRASRGPGDARGAWVTQKPQIELTYVPNFRFIETVGDFPELQPLLTPEVDPYAPSQSLPAHAFSVVSYSVSSDLSHSQSPKAAGLLQEVLEGGMDPKDLGWASRQQRFRRQLLQHSPDVICLQGLQSIGFASRCSEVERAWFECDNEPSSNHLVHLFRELSKFNYSVAFSPTICLPGSAVVCFGNAIFWKRSRWSLQQRWDITRTAVCVEIASQLGDLQVMICSVKSAASYTKDFGGDLDDEDVLEPLRRLQSTFMAETSKSGAHPVWCGEFGIEPHVLLPGLAEQRAMPSRDLPCPVPEWRSATRAVLGEDLWSSVSQNTALLALDFILHDVGLEVLAVLGGLQEELGLTDFLRAGHPSDHLMQLAVFRSMAKGLNR